MNLMLNHNPHIETQLYTKELHSVISVKTNKTTYLSFRIRASRWFRYIGVLKKGSSLIKFYSRYLQIYVSFS